MTENIKDIEETSMEDIDLNEDWLTENIPPDLVKAYRNASKRKGRGDRWDIRNPKDEFSEHGLIPRKQALYNYGECTYTPMSADEAISYIQTPNNNDTALARALFEPEIPALRQELEQKYHAPLNQRQIEKFNEKVNKKVLGIARNIRLTRLRIIYDGELVQYMLNDEHEAYAVFRPESSITVGDTTVRNIGFLRSNQIESFLRMCDKIYQTDEDSHKRTPDERAASASATSARAIYPYNKDSITRIPNGEDRQAFFNHNPAAPFAHISGNARDDGKVAVSGLDTGAHTEQTSQISQSPEFNFGILDISTNDVSRIYYNYRNCLKNKKKCFIELKQITEFIKKVEADNDPEDEEYLRVQYQKKADREAGYKQALLELRKAKDKLIIGVEQFSGTLRDKLFRISKLINERYLAVSQILPKLKADGPAQTRELNALYEELNELTREFNNCKKTLIELIDKFGKNNKAVTDKENEISAIEADMNKLVNEINSLLSFLYVDHIKKIDELEANVRDYTNEIHRLKGEPEDPAMNTAISDDVDSVLDFQA